MANIVWQGAGETRTTYPWQKKVVRTSDGTIHVVVQRLVNPTGWSTHFHSHDNGATWDAGVDLWNWDERLNPCIDVDSSDNLVAADMPSYNIKFKRATVNKTTTPWTWTWGSEVAVGGANNAYYPDILVDGNGYIHIVWMRSGNQPLQWGRSINDGASWTVTSLDSLWNGYFASIIKDINNNLYIVGAKGGFLSGSSAIKITYSAGPSWSVGSSVDISAWTGWGNRPMGHNILSDGRIMYIYQYMNDNSLQCIKTTNPYDVSTWDSPVVITASIDSGYYASLMVKNSGDIRVYYMNGGDLYYKKSTDLGATWGSEISVFSTGTNLYPNCTTKSGISLYDYVWTNGFTIYHSYSSVFGEGAFGNGITDTDNNSLVFDRIIEMSLDQTCNVALRDVPLRTSGEIMDIGTYVIDILTLKFTTRLSASEKTTLETLYDSKTVKTIYIGDWIFTGWFRKPNIVYEYETTRPWKVELIFDIYTYSYTGASVGTFSNQQLRLVGATTLDYENIIDFTVSEETSVSIPNWVNQDASIDTNVWNKTLKRMIYTVRETEYRLYKLLQILTAHTAITLYDYIHGPTNKTAWLTSVRAEWVPLKKEDITSNAFINTPWTVEFEVVVQE